MLLLSTLFSALAMWATAWWLTRHEASMSLRPLIWISVGIYLASYGLSRWLGTIGLGIAIVGLLLALMYFCGLSWLRAAIVTVVWILVQVGFAYVIAPLY